jgi:hypothetical protein
VCVCLVFAVSVFVFFFCLVAGLLFLSSCCVLVFVSCSCLVFVCVRLVFAVSVFVFYFVSLPRFSFSHLVVFLSLS